MIILECWVVQQSHAMSWEFIESIQLWYSPLYNQSVVQIDSVIC